MTKPKALSMLSVALTAIAMVVDSEAGGITSKLQITVRRIDRGSTERKLPFSQLCTYPFVLIVSIPVRLIFNIIFYCSSQ